MDIIVSKVSDILRFKHFICLKYNYPRSFGETIIHSINTHSSIKFYNLLECEIRYLIYKKVCKFKITNDMPLKRNSPSIPSFEQKIEEIFNESQVYSVTYTELVKHKSTMTKQKIDELLVNPCIKSINIVRE